MIRSISENQVLERIRIENPWWKTGSISKYFNEMRRRLYFDLFQDLILLKEVNRATVLMGPRRVGKTVMLHHLVQEIIESGADPGKVIFITIENPVYNNISLEQLYLLGKKAIGRESDEDGWYVIFDEIQYLKDWEVHLKSLVDSYRNNKFVVSGSAAAALKFASQESGAGRFTDFMLPPLTFAEFIHLKDLDRIIKPIELIWKGQKNPFYTSTHMDEFNSHFLNYINFGGYPEVIFSKEIQEEPGRYIKQDIVDKVLLRDLPGLYGISDTRELNSLFTTIAYNSGNEFSLESLSQASQVPKNTLKRYIAYLEAAFLIKIVKRIDQAGKRFKRDNFFKIYLSNPSIRSSLFSPLSSTDEFMGNMVETTIFSQWMHRDWFTPFYARWNKGEVDLVGLDAGNLHPLWAVEVKWSNRYHEKPKELKSLLKFCSENGLSHPIVTTINKEDIKKVNGINIQFLPSASYAYTVGKKTLEIKKGA